jgi:YfiH family protein
MDATLQAHGTLVRRVRNGVRFYVSPLLESRGVRHAFSTRIGGVSDGPFSSLTLGSPAGSRESRERVLENWRRLQDACGCPGRVAEVHQVHGAGIARVCARQTWERDPHADAILSDDPATPVAVRTADCCPVLLASSDGRRVAAIHAGWRGLLAGVIEGAVGSMEVHPGVLVAAVGPCIGFDAFEVGPEVLETFEARFGADAPIRRDGPDGKGHVDLAASAVRALRRAGVPETAIQAAFLCTHQGADEFFSHRRDAGITGRMAAIIQARP